MTTLDESGNVLIADSVAGVVWRLDTNSGNHQIAIDDPLMKPAAGPIPLGINGVNIRNGTLYFTNSFALTFNRVAIQSNGTAAGAAAVVVQNGPGDDFAFDAAGTAFVAQNANNTLQKITPDGVATVVAGNLNSTELAGPTAVRLGRTSADGSTLYITTTGGLAGPINGTFIEGGKVVAVDLCTLV
jgi:sugar lactone lactonase YvrE